MRGLGLGASAVTPLCSLVVGLLRLLVAGYVVQCAKLQCIVVGSVVSIVGSQIQLEQLRVPVLPQPCFKYVCESPIT